MESQNGNALSVRGRSQNKNKNKSSFVRSKSRGRSKYTGKPVKVCLKGGKEGYYKRDCKSKAPDKRKGSDDAPSAEAKTTSNEGGDVYLASSSTYVDHEAWLIDSCASFHFTPHREWFCEYEKYDGGDVFLGDVRKAKIVGCGKVKLNLKGGRIRILPGVLHILALGRNLISVSKLDDAGSTVVDGFNNSVVLESGAENLAVFGENTMLWHQRLGHVGEKGLRILHGKGMTNNSLDFDFCEKCVDGKHNQVSFPSSGKRAKQILELVHSDVFGPVKVPSLDNGGEFCKKEFAEFCKKCGIAWQKTTPYTFEQNGVAKRMNKTLMERVRSMLSGVGLGQELWVEAVETACYLVNRSPSSSLEDKTPQEYGLVRNPLFHI
eukprot:PITA_21296